jgi:hypothetical protein
MSWKTVSEENTGEIPSAGPITTGYPKSIKSRE